MWKGEAQGRAGTHPTCSVLMMWGSCRKHSNADKANMCFAFSSKHLFFKPLILFRVAGGWSLSQHALGLRFVASLLQGDFLLYQREVL